MVAQVATLYLDALVQTGEVVVGRAFQWLPDSRSGLGPSRALVELWVKVRSLT